MKKQVKIRFWLLMYVSLAQNFIFLFVWLFLVWILFLLVWIF